MSGIYLRVYRDGKYQSLDIVELTEVELTAAFAREKKETVIKFLAAVCKQIRECEPPEV